MLQFPGPFPPSTEIPPPDPGESLFLFLVGYLFTLGTISLCLPRPWFVAIFKLAFPFRPERLEDLDDKDKQW
jgi:hypothetical protein